LVSSSKLDVEKVGDVVVNPGDSKTLSVSVKNTGTVFLNKCKLKSEGGNSGLISSSDVKSLSSGQREDFVFFLNIPEDFTNNEVVDLKIECEEISVEKSFNLFLSKNTFELSLLSSELGQDNLEIVYVIKEKSGIIQDISVEFWLEDLDGNKIVIGEDSFNLEAGGEIEREVSLEIPDAGEYILFIESKSEKTVVIIEEPILIGASTGLIGRAILVAGGGRILGLGILAVIFVFIIVFVISRLLRKKVRKKSGFVKVKLKK
tara:strand:- start:66 stop:848 length:783 start_codon:yes stop_codon:yes gene_type:complete